MINKWRKNKKLFTSNQVIRAVSEESGFTPEEVEQVLNYFSFVVHRELSEGKCVSLKNMGVLELEKVLWKGRTVKLQQHDEPVYKPDKIYHRLKYRPSVIFRLSFDLPNLRHYYNYVDYLSKNKEKEDNE